MKELLPCPFCGGDAYHHYEIGSANLDTGETESRGIHFVLCNDCSAVISAFSEDEVVDAWNTRALPTHNLIVRVDKENVPWPKQ